MKKRNELLSSITARKLIILLSFPFVYIAFISLMDGIKEYAGDEIKHNSEIHPLDKIWNETTSKAPIEVPGKYIIVSAQMPNYYTFLLNTETGETWRIVGQQGNPAAGWQKMNYY